MSIHYSFILVSVSSFKTVRQNKKTLKRAYSVQSLKLKLRRHEMSERLIRGHAYGVLQGYFGLLKISFLLLYFYFLPFTCSVFFLIFIPSLKENSTFSGSYPAEIFQ